VTSFLLAVGVTIAAALAAFGAVVIVRYAQLEFRRRRRMRELKYGSKGQ
jgi:hypothetical protein